MMSLKVSRLFTIFYVPILLFLLVATPDGIDSPETWNYNHESEFLDDLSRCTTGVAAGAATPDGTPLLWKNRDVGNWQQEYHYVDDGRIPFIALTYRDSTNDYYAGINEAGFAIENSDAHNLGDWGQAYEGRWGPGPDDGKVMMHALATCRTVGDFCALMDTLNGTGRTHHSNYGVFDAFGGAAMVEAAAYHYTFYDANEAPNGIIIRANYAYSGSGVDGNNPSYGFHRHDEAMEWWTNLSADGYLNALQVFHHVVRDLTLPDLDPYPLPYDGYYDNWDYGCIPNGRAILRDRSRSVMVAQGVSAGERPDRSVIWAMVGSPIGCVFTPLWVRAGSVPPEYNINTGSRLNQIAETLRNWVTDVDAVNTWRLTNEWGTGIWDYTLPLEQWVFDKVQQFVNSPRFNVENLASFQNEMAQQVADSLENWHPECVNITEFAEPIRDAFGLVLLWGEADWGQFNRDDHPESYRVYRSMHPFRNGEPGEYLAAVHGHSFIDDDPLPTGGFYRVEAIW